MRIAVLPVARPTFDVGFAEEKLAAMLNRIDACGHVLVGETQLLLHPDEGRPALDRLDSLRFDAVVLLQLTFTDAAFVVQLAERVQGPVAIWAPKEPRAGGRLRLNAFCGLNLASHALGRNGRVLTWLYADPDEADIEIKLGAFFTRHQSGCVLAESTDGRVSRRPPYDDAVSAFPLRRRSDAADGEPPEASDRQSPLVHARVARIGEPPPGFDTCLHDADVILERFNVQLEALPLKTLFEAARRCDASAVQRLRMQTAAVLNGLDEVDADELERSLRLKLALDELQRKLRIDAFAIRCWPEMFTEYGGAVCGPVSMLGEARVPCACEADVYGALTQLALQRTADAPVFLVDLVDVDVTDDSAVVWHCGQAPLSMAAGEARATVHSNRGMPLLCEFALKAGRVTFCRLSQAQGHVSLVIATGEMLDRPMAFSGTSGVVRFDALADRVLDRLFACGLEHHMALAYGDYAVQLRNLAAMLELSLIDLTAP